MRASGHVVDDETHRTAVGLLAKGLGGNRNRVLRHGRHAIKCPSLQVPHRELGVAKGSMYRPSMSVKPYSLASSPASGTVASEIAQDFEVNQAPRRALLRRPVPPRHRLASMPPWHRLGTARVRIRVFTMD